MVHDRLQELKDRLADLELKRALEEASPQRSDRYINDLSISIKSCYDQIIQLTFARGNPLMMVNGASA